ncbi:MAG: diaminobutyrate--2-oxoglutarate transaminase [Myxococcales bacterium]|nr:diaminobutyrate--2-oxoglutarate transaminase [Myxococcales bacterium]
MKVFERLESEVRAYCRTWPVVFKSARNAVMFDEEGGRYVDFFAGAGVLNFGHNDPKMKEALIAYLQSDGVSHSLDMSTTAKRRFLERFNDVILGPRGMRYKMQFTGPTGTNAVEAALKLARKITGRQRVVAFTDGFHGMTLGALALTGNGLHRAAAGVALEHVIRVPFDGYLGRGVDTLEPLRRQLEDPSSGVLPPAAFVLETIQAEGGVNIARAEWLQSVQALAHQHGSLFIVDDIQVGCGRTGTYFSFEDLGIEPDVVCLAKGIGGYGLPMAMLLVKPEHDAWKPGEHTGTFRGQDLSFVAGTEALSYFEDTRFAESVKAKGARIRERLVRMLDAHGDRAIELRGRGMIYGIDTHSPDKAKAVSAAAFERGLIIATCGPSGRVVKVMPPLTTEDAVLDEGLDLLAGAFESAGGK